MKYFLCCCQGLLAATFFLLVAGCDKDNDPDEDDKDRVIFVGKINDTAYWKATTYSAIYYRNLNVLYVLGNNGTNGVGIGIAIDPAQPFKTYLLESYGTNFGFIGVNKKPCFSDLNIANTGGSFTLEKLDTTYLSITGKLSFRGYSEDRATTVFFESDTMQNIPLRVADTSFFDHKNNYVEKANIKATVKGVNTAEWAMPDYFFRYRCMPVSNNVGKYEILLCSVWGSGSNSGKHIRFDISNQLSPGTYQIYPYQTPNMGCGTLVTASMTMHHSTFYLPISGQMNILQIDTAARTIKAKFSMVLRDTTSRQETIEITNGEFQLDGFR